jgi:glycosyltransferase involved in cell wall biosynthesis
MYSVIVPVYRNEEFVPHLIKAFAVVARTVSERFGMETEFVFVVDASPDRSYQDRKSTRLNSSHK